MTRFTACTLASMAIVIICNISKLYFVKDNFIQTLELTIDPDMSTIQIEPTSALAMILFDNLLGLLVSWLTIDIFATSA